MVIGKTEDSTFDAAISIDLKLVQRWNDLRRMPVVVVGPRSNGITTNVGVGNGQLFNQMPDLPLFFVHGEPWLYWVCPVHIVSKLRWQEPLQHKQLIFACPITQNAE